jgi:hypothetical protein
MRRVNRSACAVRVGAGMLRPGPPTMHSSRSSECALFHPTLKSLTSVVTSPCTLQVFKQFRKNLKSESKDKLADAKLLTSSGSLLSESELAVRFAIVARQKVHNLWKKGARTWCAVQGQQTAQSYSQTYM